MLRRKRVRKILAMVLGAAAVSFIALSISPSPKIEAQATRTWVSGVGDDANPCSRTAPCKTFPGAISKTAAHGEINCLDPGGFGTVTITKSISIYCEGAIGGILAAGTNGINVNAGPGDTIILHGLDINGAGSGLIGVNYITAGAVIIENCQIYGFNQGSARGIFAGGTSSGAAQQLSVSHSSLWDNGINIVGGGGIVVGNPTGGPAAGPIRAQVADSSLARNNVGLRVHPTASVEVQRTVATGNISNNFLASSGGSTANLSIDSSSASESIFGSGITSTGPGAVVRLSNTTVQGNNIGLEISGGGSIQSYGTNMIGGNFGGNGPAPAPIPMS